MQRRRAGMGERAGGAHGHHGRVSNVWSTPDPRRTATTAPGFGTPYVLPLHGSPSWRGDAFAGLLAAVVTVLAGAPVGLLWALIAPRVDVVVQGENVSLARPGSSDFIAGDGFFLLAVTVAGVVSGLVAWRLGREHGPGVVVGLAVGGLAAAYVAQVTGGQVGLAEVQRAVEAGQQGALELSLRLRADVAMVGWPIAALVAWIAAATLRGR